MITQETLDSLGDRKVHVLETIGGKNIFIGTGGSLKDRLIYFLTSLSCYGDNESFFLGKGVDSNSPYSGLYIGNPLGCIIRKPTIQEFFKFSKSMKNNKIFYNKKTKEVKKI